MFGLSAPLPNLPPVGERTISLLPLRGRIEEGAPTYVAVSLSNITCLTASISPIT